MTNEDAWRGGQQDLWLPQRAGPNSPLLLKCRADARISARVVTKHSCYAASKMANIHPSIGVAIWLDAGAI
jgi:hypothetical protein